MKEELYVVYSPRKGYYAANQKGHYHWQYTDDVELANTWKTLEAASKRVSWGAGLSIDAVKDMCVIPITRETITTLGIAIENVDPKEISQTAVDNTVTAYIPLRVMFDKDAEGMSNKDYKLFNRLREELQLAQHNGYDVGRLDLERK